MVILFDLDGTLVDTANDIVDAVNDLCIELNYPTPDPKLIIENTSFGLKKILSIVLNMQFETIEQQKVFKFLKDRFSELYHKTNFQKSVLFPGIQELLDNLKEHKFQMAVVTNKHYKFAYLILKNLNLLSYLDCIITADMVKHPKPAPESVLLAINKLNAVPSECLFIGDAEQDIIAGNLAGVTTVSALFGYIGFNVNPESWGAAYTVYHPTEIWPLIKKLYLINNKIN